MLVSELLDECRIRLDDAVATYLWSDTELYSWINEAQIEACRRARILSSGSFAVSILAETASYDIPEKVIQIRRAKLSINELPLSFKGLRDMDMDVSGWESHAGTPTDIITDIENNRFTLYPKPVANDTLNLVAVHEPSTIVDDDSALEIPARFHYGLVDWVLFRAYSIQDADKLDKEKSTKHFALFSEEFGQRSSAKDEIFNLRQMPYNNSDGFY